MKIKMKFGQGSSPKTWDTERMNLQMEFVEDLENSFIVKTKKGEVYIPRSLVSYRRKWQEGSGRKMIDFNLPMWKVKQSSLMDFVVP